MKQLFESTMNLEWSENKELQYKAKKAEKSDETVEIIHEYAQIIKSENKNIICLAHQQGKVFEKLKENSKFVEMVKQFGYCKPTITFKINIQRLYKEAP